jgi:3-dehydroquinate synthase
VKKLHKIQIPLGKNAYVVWIAPGILCKAADLYTKVISGKKALIVSDETVYNLYGTRLLEIFRDSGIETAMVTFSPGEASKSLYTYEKILNACAAFQLTRRDALVAFGGGVTGDLTGFAAATYHRGTPFVQIPTTLLAMVDSSVGGKTGVNLLAGKNLAGAFWQPRLVLCDPQLLETLKPEIYSDGIAECLKYGVLWDKNLFMQLQTGAQYRVTATQIARCVALKSDVVLQDERDSGARQLLNFGHTMGHAIEQASGYTISHGAAVGLGMLHMAKMFCPEIHSDIYKALQGNGLPTVADISAEQIAAALTQDKKIAGNEITLVVPKRIGACELQKRPIEIIDLLLEGWQ